MKLLDHPAMYALYTTPSFDLPEKVWLLSTQPSGLIEALVNHITFVSRQLVSALKHLSDSPRVRSSPGKQRTASEVGLPPLELQQLLQDTSLFSTLLARVGGCAENYRELRGTSIVPPTIVFLQCLLNMVSGGVTTNIVYTSPVIWQGGKSIPGKEEGGGSSCLYWTLQHFLNNYNYLCVYVCARQG